MSFLENHPKLHAFLRWAANVFHAIARGIENFIDHPLDLTWKVTKRCLIWQRDLLYLNVQRTWDERNVLFRAGMVVALIFFGFTALLSAFAFYFEWHMTRVPGIDNVVYLGQNMGGFPTDNDRLDFYYTPQGAFVHDIRYDWMVYLERPWKEERFASPDNMRSYGFIVDPGGESDKNPGGLPVGFARRYDPKHNEMMLDLTCAACHTGELQVIKDGKRTSVRIDGGSAHADLMTALPGHFAGDLFISLVNTYFNPLKFRRFAANVLKEKDSWGNRWMLSSELWDVIEGIFIQTVQEKRLGIYPTEEGFGRTDGLGRIDNTAFAVNLDPKNYRVADAPVSLPAIWEMPLLDWVQYTASVREPMARNIGEAMGTGARYYLTNPYGRPLPNSERFDASTEIANLDKIEHLMRKLKPPCWPVNVFGKIDPDKAKLGKQLFEGKFNCVGCHGPHLAPDLVTASQAPYKLREKNPTMRVDDPNVPHWTVTTLAVQDIGTDPTSAIHFSEDKVDLSGTGMTPDEVRKELTPYYQKDFCRLVEYNQNLVTLLTPEGKQFLTPPAGQSPSSKSPSPVQKNRQDLAQRTCKTPDIELICPLPPSAVTLVPPTAAPLNPGDIAKLNPKPTLEGVCGDLSQLVQEGVDGYIKQKVGQIDMTSVGDGDGLNYLITQVRKRAYQNMGIDSPDREVEQSLMDGYAQLDIPQAKPMYMARPLAGIWATPPFLHNGSVASLYELLLPAYRRTKKFYVKTPLFDPHTVGFYTNIGEPGAYLYDTSVRGNYNTGHEFRDGFRKRNAADPNDPPRYGIIGPEMTEDERWAIIEYLKILRDPGDTSCPETDKLPQEKKQ
jgi:hypothetical protein